MSLYTPILVLGVIAAAFAIVSVVIALVIGPRRYNRAKLEAYECGIRSASDEGAQHGVFCYAVLFQQLRGVRASFFSDADQKVFISTSWTAADALLRAKKSAKKKAA